MDRFLDVWQYMPHGMCLLWEPWLVVLWAGSDALIFLAYMVIPLALLRVVRRRNDLKHRGLIMLFAGFILLCGLTHLLGVVTLWWPIYPYVGIVKLATGLVSVLTAIVLLRLVPVLIAIPGHSELEEVNRQLRQRVKEHESAEARLRALKETLEEKVSERTEELQQARATMAVVAREAVHRSKNLLSVVGSIARQSARDETDIKDYLTKLLGRIDALAGATATVIGGEEQASADLRTVVENQIKPLRLTFSDRVKVRGPSAMISSETAQQISLAVHELATNTQKYGALAQEEGTVEVTWTRVEGDAEHELRFTWSETHVVQAELDGAGSGFGKLLLTKIVPAMLQGTAETKAENGRFVYNLMIPTSAFADDHSADGDVHLAARIVNEDFGII